MNIIKFTCGACGYVLELFFGDLFNCGVRCPHCDAPMDGVEYNDMRELLEDSAILEDE